MDWGTFTGNLIVAIIGGIVFLYTKHKKDIDEVTAGLQARVADTEIYKNNKVIIDSLGGMVVRAVSQEFKGRQGEEKKMAAIAKMEVLLDSYGIKGVTSEQLSGTIESAYLSAKKQGELSEQREQTFIGNGGNIYGATITASQIKDDVMSDIKASMGDLPEGKVTDATTGKEIEDTRKQGDPIRWQAANIAEGSKNEKIIPTESKNYDSPILNSDKHDFEKDTFDFPTEMTEEEKEEQKKVEEDYEKVKDVQDVEY